jgi:hypothetical protein
MDRQFQNAESPINESLAPPSNLTLESGLHPRKHFSARVSTDEGILIDESDEQRWNALASIVES